MRKRRNKPRPCAGGRSLCPRSDKGWPRPTRPRHAPPHRARLGPRGSMGAMGAGAGPALALGSAGVRWILPPAWACGSGPVGPV